MKRNNIFALSIFSLFLVIGLTGCEQRGESIPKFTVTFDAGTGGTLTDKATVQVETGEKVAKPTDPTREGFSFVEWRKADGTAFPFDTETITADITLTAQWMSTSTNTLTVTFDANQGMLADGSPSNTVQVAAGEKVTKPADPTRTDYNFIAWQKNSSSPPFEFNTETITADITLTAQWEKVQYTVTFEPNQGLLAGGNDNNTVQISEGEKLPQPIDPTRADHNFVEWQKEGGTAFDFDTETITANITLTAKWRAITFTVTFAGEGVTTPIQPVPDGGMATRPPTDPTRDGFTFVNWYEDAMFNELYDFSTAVVSDITVYARWLSNTKYTVTFEPNQGMLAGGNDNNTVQISEGEKLPQPIDPTRDGSSFVEWQKTGGTAFDFDAETITAPITLTAQWADAVGSLADVAIVLNDANTAYKVNYTYTNAQSGDTGATPEVTWFLSDNANGTSPTQVSMEATYMPTGVNRYKYLVASVRVMAVAGGFTETVTVVRSPGFSTEATRGATSARFSGRHSHTSVRFKDKLWVIGGSVIGLDVWSSDDGITWAQAPGPTEQNPRFSARSLHTSVVFKDAIWVIGGDGRGRENDVWSSEDGENWTQVTDPDDGAAFSGRSSHTSVRFKDKIWVIGGYDGSNILNDVWSSTDGATWTQVTPAETGAPFSARISHSSVVFKDKIWVIGGNDATFENLNDVWSSEDGENWTQVTDPDDGAAFSARNGHTSVVFDGKIWVIGGDDGTKKLNDVWSSEDGRNWIEYTEVPKSSRFSARSSHTSVVLNNKIWVIGGLSSGYLNNGVWY